MPTLSPLGSSVMLIIASLKPCRYPLRYLATLIIAKLLKINILGNKCFLAASSLRLSLLGNLLAIVPCLAARYKASGGGMAADRLGRRLVNTPSQRFMRSLVKYLYSPGWGDVARTSGPYR